MVLGWTRRAFVTGMAVSVIFVLRPAFLRILSCSVPDVSVDEDILAIHLVSWLLTDLD